MRTERPVSSSEVKISSSLFFDNIVEASFLSSQDVTTFWDPTLLLTNFFASKLTRRYGGPWSIKEAPSRFHFAATKKGIVVDMSHSIPFLMGSPSDSYKPSVNLVNTGSLCTAKSAERLLCAKKLSLERVLCCYDYHVSASLFCCLNNK